MLKSSAMFANATPVRPIPAEQRGKSLCVFRICDWRCFDVAVPHRGGQPLITLLLDKMPNFMRQRRLWAAFLNEAVN
jgi:hypothetical protein